MSLIATITSCVTQQTTCKKTRFSRHSSFKAIGWRNSKGTWQKRCNELQAVTINMTNSALSFVFRSIAKIAWNEMTDWSAVRNSEHCLRFILVAFSSTSEPRIRPINLTSSVCIPILSRPVNGRDENWSHREWNPIKYSINDVLQTRLGIVELEHGDATLTESYIVESVCCKLAKSASVYIYVENERLWIFVLFRLHKSVCRTWRGLETISEREKYFLENSPHILPLFGISPSLAIHQEPWCICCLVTDRLPKPN